MAHNSRFLHSVIIVIQDDNDNDLDIMNQGIKLGRQIKWCQENLGAEGDKWIKAWITHPENRVLIKIKFSFVSIDDYVEFSLTHG